MAELKLQNISYSIISSSDRVPDRYHQEIRSKES